MKISSCRFERSACGPEDEPRLPGPEVAFLGRSNVGKSSLINRLLGVRGMARTSSQPGRTRTLNFYRVNDGFHFVDLPGYGYSKVPESMRRSWGPMVEGYLERRRDRICIAVLLVDARRPCTELDRLMRGWLEDRRIPFLAVATKSDKLSGNARTSAERRLREEMRDTSVVGEPILASARTGLGIRQIWKYLDDAIARGAERRVSGAGRSGSARNRER